MEIPKDFFSVKEAAFATSLKKSTIYNYINAGKLETRRVGGRTVITSESIAKLMQGSQIPAELPKSASGKHMRELLQDVALFLSGLENCTSNGVAARDLIARIKVKLG